jgi:hypothetical protein
MTSEYRRAFMDPDTLDTLLMEWSDQSQGWIPSLQAMENWRAGQLRPYIPTDKGALITMPGHVEWPYMDPTDTRDIAGLLTQPWIRDGAATVGLAEEEIDDFDIWRQAPVPRLEQPPVAPPAHWEPALIPSLHYEEPVVSVSIPSIIREENMMMLATLASQMLAASTLPVTSTERAYGPPPLPRHVASLVIADAVARDATCPITMESIVLDDAVTSCGHVFNRAAIEQWLRSRTTCPECRQHCSLSAPPPSAPPPPPPTPSPDPL